MKLAIPTILCCLCVTGGETLNAPVAIVEGEPGGAMALEQID